MKKNKAWEWSKLSQDAFEDLKKAVTEEPVLGLPDHTKPYEVDTDASDFSIGGVLMQAGHPIAYESRKLNVTERRGAREGDDGGHALLADMATLSIGFLVRGEDGQPLATSSRRRS